MMKKTAIELFAGVGGFRVGINHVTKFDASGRADESNGQWNFVWANQYEPSTKVQHAYDCYRTRFGNDVSNTDISHVDADAIPAHTLLMGGFPCQDYSVARSLHGEKGITGKKGVLFWDIARILEAKKTPFVLLENVDRLLKSPATQRGRDFGIMLRTLHDLGYDVEWRVINAAEYGARQRRRRTFIFAYRRDTKYGRQMNDRKAEHILLYSGLFAGEFPVHDDNLSHVLSCDLMTYKDTVDMTERFAMSFENTGVCQNGMVTTMKTNPVVETGVPLKDIMERDVDASYYLTEEQLAKFQHLRGSKKVERTAANGHKYIYSEGGMSPTDDIHLPGRTMLTSEASVNRSTHIVKDLDTGRIRFITPVEAERLQHFPDNWTDTGMPLKRRYFMMGNALVTYIIAKCEPALSRIVENEN